MLDAYSWLSTNGIVKDGDYHGYRAQKDQCQSTAGKDKFFNTNQIEEDNIDNRRLKQILARQPVGVAIHSNAACLTSYSHGEIKAEECDCNDANTRDVNHGVTLIGYGKSSRPDCSEYWLIKNSWGPDWGENGFFKFCSDVNTVKAPQGTCQVNSFIQYPTLD